jgi:hypothetical protein
MTDARSRARTTATALLAAPPWAEMASRALLLLVRPPATEWADSGGTLAFWLILDGAEARGLPPEPRQALGETGSYRAPGGAAEGFALVVFTSEALVRALEGVTRPSLELRWTARHSEPLHDPLHRAEGLAGVAGRLPADALERVVRPLFVQASSALRALAGSPIDGQPATAAILAGEAAAALTRLACVLEDGSHPPAEWLVPASHETQLGRRITAWLDDIGPAAAGDARAARWVRESGPGVLREAATALHAEFGGRDWLRDPEGYALRIAR